MEKEKETKQAKVLSKKEKMLLTIIGIVLVVAITVTSLTLAILRMQKAAPKVSIKVLSQPENKIVVSWNKKNTGRYLVEYWFSIDQEIEESKMKQNKGSELLSDEEKAEAYSNSVKSIYTNQTKLELDRKRGDFKVRVKGVAEKSKNDTAFSEWKFQEISAYKLEKPIISLKREGDYLRFDEFEAPSYAVSAENSGDIEFFEYYDSINSHIETLPGTELKNFEWVISSLPENLTSFTVYVRAVNYEQALDLGTKNIDTQTYWLYEPSDFAEYSVDID